MSPLRTWAHFTKMAFGSVEANRVPISLEQRSLDPSELRPK